jgi:hypothetical protein
MLQSLIKFKPETEEKIYKYERITSFSVALLASITLLIYNETKSAFLLELLGYSLFVYLFLDLFIAKGDAIAHHIFCLVGSYTCLKCIPLESQHLFFMPILSTEASTVFLILKLWMDEYSGKKNIIFKILYGINDVLFVSLFFKLRIYNFYFNLIHKPEVYIVLNKNIINIIDFISGYVGVYGLFILNIYWFSIICKKLYKQIIIKMTPFLDSKRVAEAMLTVSFFINFYIAYVNYSVNIYTNSYYLLDLFGIFVLSVASGNYHYSKYKYMKNNEVINVTTNELLEPFIYDKYAIQLRSFLALTTISLANGTSAKFIYLSGIYHIMSFLSFNMNMIKILFNNSKIIYDESDISKMIIKKLVTITSIPCLLDTILIICYHTNNVCLKTELFFISIIIFTILSVKPFYNLNHVLLHVLFLYKTNCITKYALQNQ